jgi:glycoprotein endo-alpha-1,2-mannosidase
MDMEQQNFRASSSSTDIYFLINTSQKCLSETSNVERSGAPTTTIRPRIENTTSHSFLTSGSSRQSLNLYFPYKVSIDLPMFNFANFTGHLREEDEDEWVANQECWGSECKLPSRRYTSSSRRIDMAAMINKSSSPFKADEDGFREPPSVLDQTSRTLDESDDSNNVSDDESNKAGGFGLCLCSPCACQAALVAFALLAVFVAGLGTGMVINAQDDTAIVNGLQSQNVGQPAIPAGESQPQSNYLVGAYYYPWHGSSFHNGDGYIRNKLQPAHSPTLGEYDDSKPEIISQHLAWSRQANIGLWVTSWWGPDRLEDSNTRDVIMEHDELGDMKIALHYESTNRVRPDDLSIVRTDIEYMCDRYFDHPNYYRINGRPVVFLYVTRKVENMGVLETVVSIMRSTARNCGHDIYLVGDSAFGDAPSASETFPAFGYLDAVTNYDVYGSAGEPSKYAGSAAVDNYYSDQASWRARAIENGCRYIPAVSPGYNDRGVRLASNHPPLSRRLTADGEEGSLFRYQLQKAKPLVDGRVDKLLMVNSFNEWHEDTQIEPALGEPTTLPEVLTGGMEYSGYGELYLNLLRESTLNVANIFENRGN